MRDDYSDLDWDKAHRAYKRISRRHRHSLQKLGPEGPCTKVDSFADDSHIWAYKYPHGPTRCLKCDVHRDQLQLPWYQRLTAKLRVLLRLFVKG